MEPGGSLLRLQEPATCPYPEPDQSSPYPDPASWRSILILSSHLLLALPSGFFPSGFPTSPLSHTCYVPCPSNFSRFDHPNNIGWGVSSSLCSFLHSPFTSSLLGPNILFSTVFSNTLNASDHVSHPYKTTGTIILSYTYFNISATFAAAPKMTSMLC